MANLFGLPLTNDYGADQSRQRRISDLIGSGRNFNQQEAQDFASAFGISDPQRFVGIGGQQALQFARKFNPNQSISNPFDPSTNLPFLKRMAGAKLPFTNITVPNVIPSDMVFGSKKFNSVDQPQDNTDVTSFRQGVDPLMEQLKQYNNIDQPVQDLQQEGTGLQNKFLEAMRKLFPAKANRELDIRNEFGLGQSVKDLQKLQALASQKIASFDAGMQAVEGKVIPMEAIAGQQSFLQRQKAVELGGIATMAAALQGNIELAESYAKSTVDLEFAPQQNELDILQKQLDYNKENMTSAELRRKEKLDVQLKERQAEIDAAKIDKEGILKIGIEAAKNGANSSILNAISQSKTGLEALSKAGSFLKTTETETVEVDGKRKLINSQTGEVIADLGKATSAERASISEQLAALEGGYNISYDTEGNPVVSDPAQGIVGGYDISSYATDGVEPNDPLTHEQKVASILEKVGTLTTPEEIDSYIQSVAPGSPITSTMIQNTSEKYGVSWEMLIAMMQQDSSLGTKGLGTRNFNPGNIAQYDSLGTTPTKGYKSWQQGVDAVGKWLSDHKATQTQNGDNKDALNVILASDKFTKDQKKSITQAINSGEDPFTIIKNQAKNIMGQTLATDLDKYETAKEQLVSIQNLLDSYYANGGETSLFKGGYEKAINKLGKVDDPNLVEIATNISAALQIYRNAVSGTAYSVQEGKDIASIFPGINKSEGLNKAILKGRMAAFETTIDQKYKNTLGSVYDRLKKSSQTNQQPTSSLQWVSASGNTYNLPYE